MKSKEQLRIAVKTLKELSVTVKSTNGKFRYPLYGHDVRDKVRDTLSQINKIK